MQAESRQKVRAVARVTIRNSRHCNNIWFIHYILFISLSHLRGVGCAGDLPVVWQRDPELHVLLPALGLAQVPHLPPPPHAVTLNIGEALRPAVYLLDTRYNLNI